MSHWYNELGEPMHFVENKTKGGTRPTTLRDARKLNLRPSVTEILKVADKPALTRWKVEQAYLAAMTLPRLDGETLDQFIERAKQDANQQTVDAINIGEEMHAAVEAYYKKQPFNPKYREVVAGVSVLLEELTGLRQDDWISEMSFATNDYGGMIDLHTRKKGGVIVDLKSKDFSADDKRLWWAEQDMQLTAYANGIGLPNARRINIYMSRNNLGLVRHHEWEVDDDTAWRKFACLLDYWMLDKNYCPSEGE